MMSLWDALRMNMMISYQELVRTFPKPLSLSSISVLLFWFPDFIAVTFNLCFCRFGFTRFCYRT
ncbi:TPA: hypothetical protein MH686_27485 [Klebsiella pneumoniae]|nr:hypothetical protein [Klebsiella pneumoniae]